MRKSSSEDISIEQIRSAESLRKVLKNDEGYPFLQNIRGSPMYWERSMRDAFAMLRQVGLPAFFYHIVGSRQTLARDGRIYLYSDKSGGS